jgi:predicted nucleic acid-binding protein
VVARKKMKLAELQRLCAEEDYELSAPPRLDPRTQADMLIAATAALHGLTLATRNERDFEDCGVTVINPFR